MSSFLTFFSLVRCGYLNCKIDHLILLTTIDTNPTQAGKNSYLNPNYAIGLHSQFAPIQVLRGTIHKSTFLSQKQNREIHRNLFGELPPVKIKKAFARSIKNKV
jgi:hypothetical protein